jgi:flagellar biosynthesis protein FlhF
MTIRRYVAATVREAMRDVRRDLGDEAVILSNRRVGAQVEILAAAPDAMEALVERSAPRTPPGRSAARGPASPVAVESFQEFIRRQSQARAATTAAAAPRGPAPKAVQRQAAPPRGVQMYNDVAAGLPADHNAHGSESAWSGAPWTAADDLPLPAAATGWYDTAAAQGHGRPVRDDAAAAAPGAQAALQAPTQQYPQPQTQPQTQPQPHVQPPAAAPQPQFEAHLPAAPAVAAAPAPGADVAQAAPAVFRRRPARSVVGDAAAVTAGPMPTPGAPAAAAAPAAPAAPAPDPAAAAPAAPGPHPQGSIAPMPAVPPPAQQPGAAPPTVRAAQPQPAQADPRLVAELQAMRTLLQEQLASLSSRVAAADAQRRNPLQVRLMTRLLTAGFSPELARYVASNAPHGCDDEQAETWLHEVLALNLKCVAENDGIVERGGVYALVGPTGVGKTTTVAKLAARYAVRHGTSTLALITLDGYRIGAHDQLRTYGRILGTPVHLAQDTATLRELLASMPGKRLVLIDTCGLSQRDARLAETMNALAAAGTPQRPVQRVLLINSASHAETIEDVARAWRAHEAAGAILTKLDEAARIGGALDALLRHKLALFGLTNGQRVPEDWHPANGRLLAHLSLKPAQSLFALADSEGAVLAHTAAAGSAAHA